MGPSCSMASVVSKSLFLQGPCQILFHQTHDTDLPKMIFSRVSQLSIPDYFFRAHDNESELRVQFPPGWNLGSTSFPSASTPGLCQPETQRDL